MAVVLLAGCMTKREYQLRSKDIQAKTLWPATYAPLAIKGPLTLDADSELVITVPNMPYSPTAIPDGQSYQLRALGLTAVTAGAITGGYFIKRSGGDTTKTIINNNGGAQ
ncbi:MAG: hypothetical protein IJJ33_04440 [Victivallales bacterium]|nr:hypothetical protein [Victivallales bacterium]